MNSPPPPQLLFGHPYPAVDANAPRREGQRAAALAAWRAAFGSGARALADATAGIWGDFAVGIDDPASGCSFIAVDRFSIRTLCYRIVNGRLHYAERADELAGDDAEIDPQAIFEYLVFHGIPSPRTIFKNVWRLPPGHCAHFADGRLTVLPYALPRFEEPSGAVSLAALKDEFVRRVERAVARQISNGVPACFLSGGTDSSTLAGMIARVTGEPAHTYSIGFEAEGYDEMAYARIAARRFGTVHHEYYFTPDDLVANIGRVATHYDQPFGNSSALPAYCCASRARADGVAHLLAGDGGDELFGGNVRYAKQRVFDWYRILPAPLRTGVLEPITDSPLGSLPGLAKVRSYVEQARTPMPDRLKLYNLIYRLGTAEVLTRDFRERIDEEAPLELQRQVWAQASSASELNRHLAYDWRFTLAESDLPKVRGTTELAGISVAFPFLDVSLLEFSAALPARFKLKGLELRWFFKEALRGFLPDEIIAKKKHGFGLPFGVWATRHAPLKALALGALDRLAERGIVRPDFIRKLVREHLVEHPGYYGEMVWILMILEHWLGAHAPAFSFDRG